MQFALPLRVFTTWWKRCRWTCTNHPCLRWHICVLHPFFVFFSYINFVFRLFLGWTRANSTNFTGCYHKYLVISFSIFVYSWWYLFLLQGGSEVCPCASGWQWHLLLATQHYPPVQDSFCNLQYRSVTPHECTLLACSHRVFQICYHWISCTNPQSTWSSFLFQHGMWDWDSTMSLQRGPTWPTLLFPVW